MPAILAVFCILAFPQWPVLATLGFVGAAVWASVWGDGTSQFMEVVLFFLAVASIPILMFV